MIHEISNPYLRRAVLVFTVASIIVCMGPVCLIRGVLRWVKDEFEADLPAIWRGEQNTKRTK